MVKWFNGDVMWGIFSGMVGLIGRVICIKGWFVIEL